MTDKAILESTTRTLNLEAQGIEALADRIPQEAMVKAVRILGDCKGRIIVAGCGTSGAAGKKIVHSLCCIERSATFLVPSDAVHGSLGVLQKDDVLILISKGGNTKEIINLIPAGKTKGAYLIGVTENSDSVLAKQSDLVLPVSVDREPCPFNMLATASTMAVVATFDAICIALMTYTGYTREQFAVIHPGGAVGDRLLSGEQDRL